LSFSSPCGILTAIKIKAEIIMLMAEVKMT